MLYSYIKENYKKGEPIFLSELPGNSKDYIRQEMKRLTDEEKLNRLFNGVYYLPYTTILGTEGRVSVEKFVEKKYLENGGQTTGYITGLQLANKYGFTTQNPAVYEVASNLATTKQRKNTIDGKQIIVYKPVTKVTEENKDALQFLDLMSTIDKYSELTGDSLRRRLKEYAKIINLNFEQVKKYLPLYPDKTYRNIYNGGLMNELV